MNVNEITVDLLLSALVIEGECRLTVTMEDDADETTRAKWSALRRLLISMKRRFPFPFSVQFVSNLHGVYYNGTSVDYPIVLITNDETYHVSRDVFLANELPVSWFNPNDYRTKRYYPLFNGTLNSLRHDNDLRVIEPVDLKSAESVRRVLSRGREVYISIDKSRRELVDFLNEHLSLMNALIVSDQPVPEGNKTGLYIRGNVWYNVSEQLLVDALSPRARSPKRSRSRSPQRSPLRPSPRSRSPPRRSRRRSRSPSSPEL